MADRERITGALLDGLLALDHALSLDSVAIKARRAASGAVAVLMADARRAHFV